MLRRTFLKVATAAAAFPLHFITKAGAKVPPKKAPSGVIALFNAEIDLMPRGHVMKSIIHLEHLTDGGFYDIVRGLSLGIIPGEKRYFSVRVTTLEFQTNYNYRNLFIKDMVTQLSDAWSGTEGWGVAPKYR